MEITWPGSRGARTKEVFPLIELDVGDRAVLMALQAGIPLTTRPFEAVGELAGMPEDEVIQRIRRMEQEGILRKVGAIIAPRKMGYVSTLAALNVPEEEIEKTSEIINEFKGVTHNYLREGEPNIWFAMTEPDEATLEQNLGEIEKVTGRSVLRMPVEKLYKIGVKFDI